MWLPTVGLHGLIGPPEKNGGKFSTRMTAPSTENSTLPASNDSGGSANMFIILKADKLMTMLSVISPILVPVEVSIKVKIVGLDTSGAGRLKSTDPLPCANLIGRSS